MSLKQFEQMLYEIKLFENPKIQYEQYPTSSHLSSYLLYTIKENGDIENKSIADFGCGTGILSIGAKLLGAEYVCGFEIDNDALDIAKENILNYELDIDLIQCDITNIELLLNNDGYVFDTIIMNPPFGTRDKGIDIKFVEKALKYAPVVYSLHKTSTKAYILKKSQQWKVKCKAIAHMKYDIPKMYSFHTKKSQDIEVDVFKFERM